MAADLPASMVADLADFTAADFTDFTAIGFMLAGSTAIDFAIAGFSSVERSHIPGGVIIRIMGTTITANPTPRRLGTIAPILPAITHM